MYRTISRRSLRALQSKFQSSRAERDPRASATADIITGMVRYIASATPGISGRRRTQAALLAPWVSTPAGSILRIATTVRSAFSCVASRKREGPLGPGTKPPSPPSGPDPLGENQSLSSPPLEPRGLLLSVMRQKVGKERSQGVFAPLANPRRNCPNLAKPSYGPTPAVLCKASSNLRVPSGTEPRPGWRWLAHSAGVQFPN